ncbi:MAG TPA: hypothetical protein VF898_12990 [Chloroflexota bacterium]
MQNSWTIETRQSWFTLATVTIAGICVAVGATSLIDAADGWHDMLVAITIQRHNPNCTTVPGWGDGGVLLFTGAALAMLGLTAVSWRQSQGWGRLTVLATLVPISLLWLDTLSVAGAPMGDCDGAGLTGAAGAAIVRAGWLFFIAAILCVMSAVALTARANEYPIGPLQ